MLDKELDNFKLNEIKHVKMEEHIENVKRKGIYKI